MTAADTRVAVLCTLAKHHLGDHDERGTPARSACRKVIRYKRSPIDPADVPPDSGAAGTPDALPNIPPGAASFDHTGDDWRDGIYPTEGARVGGCDVPASIYPHLHEPGSCSNEAHYLPASPLSTGPTCADRGGIVTAWLGDAPPGWKPGMRPPCVACGAESGEECRSAAPPEPSTTDLIEAVDVCQGWVESSGAERDRAANEHSKALASLARRLSALAKHVGAGKLVQVGGATFKAIAPRKPRGGEPAPDALWTLVPVEVAK